VNSSLAALSSLLLILGLGACATEGLIPTEGMGPDAQVSQKIHGGSAPDAWYHDAVVSLHEVSGGYVYTDPFCTGTLISEEHVVTAGHCVESGRGVMRPTQVAIYVGDNPYADLASHIYTVSDVEQHPDYNGRRILHDIALLTLATPITESLTPVEPLPSAQGFSSSDIGMTVNFAGFGETRSGAYGEKLQVDLTLGGLGCTVRGCTGTGDADTQVSYRQNTAGPCSGDSGGPMFVFRGSETYVGGVTSYGDYYCNQYGVSTRVDAFESWITAYTGGSSGGGSSTTGCTGFDESYTGTLTGDDDFAYEPGGSSYASRPGTHQAQLTGDSGTDFDLYLYKYNRRTGSWREVASSEDSGSAESVTYEGRGGEYTWVVYSYSGGGDYQLCLTHP
jgi:trypsin